MNKRHCGRFFILARHVHQGTDSCLSTPFQFVKLKAPFLTPVSRTGFLVSRLQYILNIYNLSTLTKSTSNLLTVLPQVAGAPATL